MPRTWLPRFGAGLFPEPTDLTWRCRVSAAHGPRTGALGYCAEGAECAARRVARGATAVLPVGFAEFRGDRAWMEEREVEVVDSGASTTTLQVHAEAGTATRTVGWCRCTRR